MTMLLLYTPHLEIGPSIIPTCISTKHKGVQWTFDAVILTFKPSFTKGKLVSIMGGLESLNIFFRSDDCPQEYKGFWDSIDPNEKSVLLHPTNLEDVKTVSGISVLKDQAGEIFTSIACITTKAGSFIVEFATFPGEDSPAIQLWLDKQNEVIPHGTN